MRTLVATKNAGFGAAPSSGFAMPAESSGIALAFSAGLTPIDRWTSVIKRLSPEDRWQVLYRVAFASPEDGARIAVALGAEAKSKLFQMFVSPHFNIAHRDFVESFFPTDLKRPSPGEFVVVSDTILSREARILLGAVAQHYGTLLGQRRIAFGPATEMRSTLSPGELAALRVIEIRLRTLDCPRVGLGRAVDRMFQIAGGQEAVVRLKEEVKTSVGRRLGIRVEVVRGEVGYAVVETGLLAGRTQRPVPISDGLDEVQQGASSFKEFYTKSAKVIVWLERNANGAITVAQISSSGVERFSLPQGFRHSQVPLLHTNISPTHALTGPNGTVRLVNSSIPSFPLEFVPCGPISTSHQVGTAGDIVVFAERHPSMPEWIVEHSVSATRHSRKTLKGEATVYALEDSTIVQVQEKNSIKLRVHSAGKVQSFTCKGEFLHEPQQFQNGFLGMLSLPGNRCQLIWSINGGDIATSPDFQGTNYRFHISDSRAQAAVLLLDTDGIVVIDPPRSVHTILPGVKELWCDDRGSFAVAQVGSECFLHRWNGMEWKRERPIPGYQTLPNRRDDTSQPAFMERTVDGTVATAFMAGRFVSTAAFDSVECGTASRTHLLAVGIKDGIRSLCSVSVTGDSSMTNLTLLSAPAKQVRGLGERAIVTASEKLGQPAVAILCESMSARILSTSLSSVRISAGEDVALISHKNLTDSGIILRSDGSESVVQPGDWAECFDDGVLTFRNDGTQPAVVQFVSSPPLELEGRELRAVRLLEIVTHGADRSTLERTRAELEIPQKEVDTAEVAHMFDALFHAVVEKNPDIAVGLVPTKGVSLDPTRIDSMRLLLIPGYGDQRDENPAPEPAVHGKHQPIQYELSRRLNGGDPLTMGKGSEVVAFDRCVTGFLVTNLRGRYSAGSGTWAESSVAPSSFAPKRATRMVGTIEVPETFSGTIVLPRLFGNPIDAKSVVSVEGNWWKSRNALTHSQSPSGVLYLTQRDRGSSERIEYTTFVQPTIEPPVELTPAQLAEFTESFSGVTGNEFSEPLCEFDADVQSLIKSLRDIPVHLRGQAIESIVQEYGYYDMDAESVNDRFDALPITELIRSMRDRVSELSAVRPDLEAELKGKLFAGTCPRFAALSAALAREAGLFASVGEGLIIAGTKSVTDGHKHALAYYWWPTSDLSGIREIAIDGTPPGASIRAARDVTWAPTPKAVDNSQRSEDDSESETTPRASKSSRRRERPSSRIEESATDLRPNEDGNGAIPISSDLPWEDVLVVQHVLDFNRYSGLGPESTAISAFSGAKSDTAPIFEGTTPTEGLQRLLGEYLDAWSREYPRQEAAELLVRQFEKAEAAGVLRSPITAMCRGYLLRFLGSN